MSNKLEKKSEPYTEEGSEVLNNLTESNSSEDTADTTDCSKTEDKLDTQLSKVKAVLHKAFKNIYVKALLVTLSLVGAVSATAFFAIMVLITVSMQIQVPSWAWSRTSFQVMP